MKWSIILILAIVVLSGCITGAQTADTASFAQCLTEKEVVMYGAFWCSHCADEKKLFGAGWKNMTYVECDAKGKNPQTELCLEKDIAGYPTFIFADESRLEGVQSLEVLAQKTGCILE
ncbi:MAG: hypothetical protein ACI8Y7_000294 [Candidatus Woesearchaeota archaeon]|jgi:hypothetical protein